MLAAHSRAAVRVRLEAASDQPAAAELLRRAGASVALRDDHLMVEGVDNPAWVTRTLAAHDLFVAELAPVTADLESVFLELTGTVPVADQHHEVGRSAAVAEGVSA